MTLEPLGIAFTTPGLIPIEAFTTFGVNAKPNSQNPIGYFGTGLKYAIAVIMRHNIGLIIWIGKIRYEFLPVPRGFRDKEFTFIKMRKSTGLLKVLSTQELPFTTELGKNWELWQAFRELEANTRDENGSTDPVNQQIMKIDHTISNQTQILVGGTDFVDVWRKRDDIFLNKEALTLRFNDEKTGVEVYNKPSQHVYYRGMRVYDLPKEKVSKYTYNIISTLTLTEDRTVKYDFYVTQALAQVVMRSDDEEFIRAIVESDKDSFEASFPFDNAYVTASQTFMDVMARHKSTSRYLPRAYSYYRAHTPPPPKKPGSTNLNQDIKKWQESFIQDDDDKEELCIQANKLFNRVLRKESIEPDAETSTPEQEPEQLYVPEVILIKKGSEDDKRDGEELVEEHEVVMAAATSKDIDNEVPF